MSYRTVDTSRRVIDLATGILGSIARALVAIAGSSGDSVPYRAEAFDAWADLLAARANLFEPNVGAMQRF
jgi:hypothetical protein